MNAIEEADGDLNGRWGYHRLAPRKHLQARFDLLVGRCLTSGEGPCPILPLPISATELRNIPEPINVYSIDLGKPAQAKPTQRTGPPRLFDIVLPFANIGGDQEQEYFVDGITESLTHTLSRVADNVVAACNTAFTHKQQIDRPLDPNNVVALAMLS